MTETMTLPAPQAEPTKLGPSLEAISKRMVSLHKEHYGKGPTRTRTYVNGDLVVVLLWGGFTRVENTLKEGGKHGAVVSQRSQFQDVMRERFTEVVEDELGRRVFAMMSCTHLDPDVCAEVFVLEPVARDDDA